MLGNFISSQGKRQSRDANPEMNRTPELSGKNLNEARKNILTINKIIGNLSRVNEDIYLRKGNFKLK